MKMCHLQPARHQIYNRYTSFTSFVLFNYFNFFVYQASITSADSWYVIWAFVVNIDPLITELFSRSLCIVMSLVKSWQNSSSVILISPFTSVNVFSSGSILTGSRTKHKIDHRFNILSWNIFQLHLNYWHEAHICSNFE